MSHNYYRKTDNMSFLSVEVNGTESKKDMDILYGGRGNKSTSETKHDTKGKHKIIYTVPEVSEIRYRKKELLL